jgi:hypothetical protein
MQEAYAGGLPAVDITGEAEAPRHRVHQGAGETCESASTVRVVRPVEYNVGIELSFSVSVQCTL